MNYSTEKRAEEMQLAIALWKESGLTKYAFCKREKLSRSTFNNWLVKCGYELSAPLKKAHKKKSSVSKTKKRTSFVAVNLEATPAAIVPSSIELEYPNGVKLRLPLGLADEQLRSFIKLY